MDCDLPGSAGRWVVGGWLLVAMVTTWSYTGNLMSQLTVRAVPLPFQTGQDIIDDPHINVITEQASAYTDIMEVGHPVIRTILASSVDLSFFPKEIKCLIAHVYTFISFQSCSI